MSNCKGSSGKFEGAALFSDKGTVFQPGSTGSSGSTCEGCAWHVRQQCEVGGRYVCHQPMRCDSDNDGRPDSRQMEVRFMGPNDPDWRHVGSYCEGIEGELHTVEDIGQQVQADWKAYLPELRPTMEPRGTRTLVDFRTIFHSGQPATFGPKEIPVYDFTIRLEAKGRWFWQFEPETAEKAFDLPGSRWPDKTVGHDYTKAGDYSPTVRAEWQGQFWVGTQGPWEIQTPATQGPASLQLQVIEKKNSLGD
ncbi:MAG TPA: hypothetical protein VI076_11055 [Actinopolymorphaceae bacterium]